MNVAGSNPAGNCDAFKGGTQLPKHFGQSGHPNPAPETRTRPPINIKTYVAMVDKNANLENSFNGSPIIDFRCDTI